jgi:hypothetical protein
VRGRTRACPVSTTPPSHPHPLAPSRPHALALTLSATTIKHSHPTLTPPHPSRYFVFTSNIDGYFLRSEYDPARLYESHGTLSLLQCTSVGAEEDVAAQGGGAAVHVGAGGRTVLPASSPTHANAAGAAGAAGAGERGNLGPGVSATDAGVVATAGSAASASTPATSSAEAAAADASVRTALTGPGVQPPPPVRYCGAGLWPTPPTAFAAPATALSQLPVCAKCGRLARPNVSHCTDNDYHLVKTRKLAQEEAMDAFLENHGMGAEGAEGAEVKGRGRGKGKGKGDDNEDAEGEGGVVVLELGCGTSIHSLRTDSELLVARYSGGGGATLVRVDPGDARVPSGHAHIGIQATADVALSALAKALAAAGGGGMGGRGGGGGGGGDGEGEGTGTSGKRQRTDK